MMEITVLLCGPDGSQTLELREVAENYFEPADEASQTETAE